MIFPSWKYVLYIVTKIGKQGKIDIWSAVIYYRFLLPRSGFFFGLRPSIHYRFSSFCPLPHAHEASLQFPSFAVDFFQAFV